MTITKLFYQIYTAAFMKSLNDPNVPKIVKMFFNFGYVDETTCCVLSVNIGPSSAAVILPVTFSSCT